MRENLLTQLRRLSAGLQAADEKIRRISPKCSTCGKPTGGIVQFNQTKAEAGLCVCGEREEKP